MHSYLISIISRLNQNKLFRFISSIRLAVPVMIGLIFSVAAGTIFESVYNSEYARMAVYNTGWFYVLLCLLWINIFSSMMSRYPWKKHHTGFVITHTGILTLLIGSFVTAKVGLDGSLQIPENQTNNVLILPRLMVAYQIENSPTLNAVVFDKSLHEKSEGQLDFINDKIGHMVKVERFVPFAAVEKGYTDSTSQSGPVGVSFGMKSQFFDVKQWLHSVDSPVLQLGPATLKLILDEGSAAAAPSPARRPLSSAARQVASDSSSSADFLRISDFKTKKELMKVDLSRLNKPLTYKGITISVTKSYQRAIVANNKIVDSEDPNSPPNRALELSVTSEGKTLREVLYAKFPGFSLNQSGVFGLQLELIQGSNPSPENTASSSELPPGHPQVSEKSKPTEISTGLDGNVIEFHVNRQLPNQVRVELWKKGAKVAEKMMKEGDTFQTPWMGMQLFIASISFGSEATTDVRAVKPASGKQLPPSALLIRPTGAEKSLWLTQGESKSFQIGDKNIHVVFANETYVLPFSLKLLKFTKRDYPGTETPYSYESLVKLETDQSEHLISMNEPLKAQGYTLYQASYVMNPGQPPVTVLSVNDDPGRPIKYAGSLILALGIIIFTLMKSRLYKTYVERKST